MRGENAVRTTQKLEAGGPMPAISVAKVGGGEIEIGAAAGWQMVVIYRGKHCPICRTYLKGLKFVQEKNYLIRGTVRGAKVLARHPKSHRDREAISRKAFNLLCFPKPVMGTLQLRARIFAPVTRNRHVRRQRALRQAG